MSILQLSSRLINTVVIRKQVALTKKKIDSLKTSIRSQFNQSISLIFHLSTILNAQKTIDKYEPN